MHPNTTRWASLLAPLALMAGACSTDYFAFEHGNSTRISNFNNGDSSVKVRRPGYALTMQSEGQVTFTDDESDVASLEAKGRFELAETIGGVLREYIVEADRSGALSREYFFEGESTPMDDAAKQWLAAALPRMFRESGFDVEARIVRLLARGGPERVLQEVNLATSDYAKASYLGRLLETTPLDAAQADLALASASKIDSDYELRRALNQALHTQSLDAKRLSLLLTTGRQIDSDYELTELLLEAMERLPADAEPLSAWLDAARQLDSDYELGRAIEAGLKHCDEDAAFTARLIQLGADQLESDYELGQILKRVAHRKVDAALASAYLDAVGSLDSDYERRNALEAIAPSVVSDAELNRRYRELARTMSDYERGQALKALDDAM